MLQTISTKNSLETPTSYRPFREVWIETALAVAALGLVIFGTSAYFEVGVLSGIPPASYFAYGAWVGAFLFVGGAVAKLLFKGCLSNVPDDNNLRQQSPLPRNAILGPLPSEDTNELKSLRTQESQLQAKPNSFGGRTEQKSHFRWDYIQFCLEHELQHADNSNNFVGPDDSELSNLFLRCQDPEILFISRENNRACRAFNINNQSNMKLLTEKLRTAFLEGKKMAFAILDTGGHAIAAGFSSEGPFIIVNSLFGQSIDPKKIGQMLNKAHLKDNRQKEIHFNGQFINTCIQKGGHECLRFATLYCYHMAVRKDLTAFEEVNGAFLEGRLKCFEDCNKITGSLRIQSLKDNTCDYRTFMHSWLYRSFGLTVDAWSQLTLNELSAMQGEFNEEMISCYLTKSYFPKFYPSSDFNLEIVSSSFQGVINAQTVNKLNLLVSPALHVPMEDALFKDDQSYLLVFIKNNPQPHLYLLERGAKVEYSLHQSSKKGRT